MAIFAVSYILEREISIIQAIKFEDFTLLQGYNINIV